MYVKTSEYYLVIITCLLFIVMSLLCPFPHAVLCLGLYSTTFITTLTVCSPCKWPDSIIGNIWTMSSTLGFQTPLSLASLSLALLSVA